MTNITGLIITGLITAISIIKFKLIEELVQKISSNNEKARGHTILLISAVIIILIGVSASLPSPVDQSQPHANESAEIAASDSVPPEKSDLEIKVEAVKEGITLADQLVQQAKENKRTKDSAFAATRGEYWVYKIGDWVGDEKTIIERYDQLQAVANIKLLRQKRNYLFVKDDVRTKDELLDSLDVIRKQIPGVGIDLIDLKSFLSRRKDKLIETTANFRVRRKKVSLKCFEVD